MADRLDAAAVELQQHMHTMQARASAAVQRQVEAAEQALEALYNMRTTQIARAQHAARQADNHIDDTLDEMQAGVDALKATAALTSSSFANARTAAFAAALPSHLNVYHVAVGTTNGADTVAPTLEIMKTHLPSLGEISLPPEPDNSRFYMIDASKLVLKFTDELFDATALHPNDINVKFYVMNLITGALEPCVQPVMTFTSKRKYESQRFKVLLAWPHNVLPTQPLVVHVSVLGNDSFFNGQGNLYNACKVSHEDNIFMMRFFKPWDSFIMDVNEDNSIACCHNRDYIQFFEKESNLTLYNFTPNHVLSEHWLSTSFSNAKLVVHNIIHAYVDAFIIVTVVHNALAATGRRIKVFLTTSRSSSLIHECELESMHFAAAYKSDVFMLVHVDDSNVQVQTRHLTNGTVTHISTPAPTLTLYADVPLTTSISHVTMEPFVMRMLLVLNGNVVQGVIDTTIITAPTLVLTLHPARTLLVETDYVTHAFETEDTDLVLVGNFKVASMDAMTLTQAYEVRKYVDNNCVVRIEPFSRLLDAPTWLESVLFKPQLNSVLISFIDYVTDDGFNSISCMTVPITML